MKCPGCQTENENGITSCVSCGRTLKPRRRKRDGVEAVPLTPEAQAFFARARMIYKIGLWALVPVAGIVLGPLALVGALRLGGPRFKPEQPGRALVRVAFWLGVLNATTQWAGAVLLLLWWRS